jgi:hypothetical protein
MLYIVDLESNNLRGVFPREWSKLKGQIITLSLRNNPGLTGCAPLDASTTVTYENTGMSGYCKAEARETEAQQVLAVQSHFVQLLGAGSTQEYIGMLQQLVLDVAGLGVALKAGQTTSQFYRQLDTDGFLASDVTVAVELFQGTTYITSINVTGGGAGGLNLTHLVPLVQSLPRITTFVCKQCSANAELGPQDLLLPSQLAQAAPLMKFLELTGCGVKGPLPTAWGSWGSLEALYLGPYDFETNEYLGPNALTGSIPASYANMGKLAFLELSENLLTGTLPPEFGAAGKMPNTAVFYLQGITNLQGPIPLSWSYFSLGSVDVGGSNINLTCIPDGLFVLFNSEIVQARPCSGTRPDVNALVNLQRLIYRSGAVSDALATWDGNDRGGAGRQNLLAHMLRWFNRLTTGTSLWLAHVLTICNFFAA